MRWNHIHVRGILVWIAVSFQAVVCLAQDGSTHAVVISSGAQSEASAGQYRSGSLVIGQTTIGESQGGQFDTGAGFVNLQVFDGSAPNLPSVADGIGGDIDISYDPSQLCYEWDAVDPQSAVYGAQLDIGTTPGGTDVLEAMVLGEDSVCVVGPFAGCQTYFGTIRARNGARLLSAALTTDGVYLDDLVDIDNDNLGNACDPDDDNDGILDGVDACPCDPFNDVDGDGICADDPQCGLPTDNCPVVSNPSQYDSDMDGTGDACQSSCSLLVTPNGLGDCPTIQACIDQGKTCDIVLAAGVYDERVLINRGVTLRPAGAPGSATLTNTSPGATLIIDSGDATPVVLRDLDVTGSDTAIQSLTSWIGRGLLVRDVVTGLGMSNPGLDPVHVTLVESQIQDTGTAIVSSKTDVEIDRSQILRSSVRGLSFTDGALTVTSSLIDEAATECFDLNGTVSTLVSGSTVVECGIGIFANGTGRTTVQSSILNGHLQDITGVSCLNVSVSGLQTSCCLGSNLCLAPQFVNATQGDYRLSPMSPLIEVGIPANGYGGSPKFDLQGFPRLLDSDHDGFAIAEMGAYESFIPSLNRPGPVFGVQFQSATLMTWSPELQAQTYRVYARSLTGLTFFTDPACLTEEPLASVVLADVPLPGEGFFFLVSSVDALNQEGTVGFGTFAERSAIQSCP
ncbi:MAG: thrombospondin type 3 repeat-containing protein [Acidobacteriota bacterium]|nr:thrombospondin type 3 repeat-containing protein [Acidobacteriota bacterium]MDH3784412.1 thrombospondin type 3 repeat-containing protein [Acidobacteriota bacterium]